MLLQIEDFEQLLQNEVAAIDSPARQKFAESILVKPFRKVLKWEYGNDEEFPAWVFADLMARGVFAAYCLGGHGALGSPWGLVSLDDDYFWNGRPVVFQLEPSHHRLGHRGLTPNNSLQVSADSTFLNKLLSARLVCHRPRHLNSIVGHLQNELPETNADSAGRSALGLRQSPSYHSVIPSRSRKSR